MADVDVNFRCLITAGMECGKMLLMVAGRRCSSFCQWIRRNHWWRRIFETCRLLIGSEMRRGFGRRIENVFFVVVARWTRDWFGILARLGGRMGWGCGRWCCLLYRWWRCTIGIFDFSKRLNADRRSASLVCTYFFFRKENMIGIDVNLLERRATNSNEWRDEWKVMSRHVSSKRRNKLV